MNQPPRSARGPTGRQRWNGQERPKNHPASRKPADPVSGRPIRGPQESRQAYINRKRAWSRKFANSSRETNRSFYFSTKKTFKTPKARSKNSADNREQRPGRTGKTSTRNVKPKVVKVEHKTHVNTRAARLGTFGARASRASRIIRQLPWGIDFLSSVALAFEGRFRIWQEPGVKEYFELTAGVFGAQEFAVCGVIQILCLATIGPHFGLQDVLEALKHPAILTLGQSVNLDMVRNVWDQYDNSLTALKMLECWKTYGDAAVWLPLYQFAKIDLTWRTYWVAETALEIGSRFCLPLGVTLTVIDVFRAMPSVLDNFWNRVNLHYDLFTPIPVETRSTPYRYVELRQRVERIHRTFEDGTQTVEDQLQETAVIGHSSAFAGSARAAATGVGTLVGAPVAVGVALAAVGVAGGLALASTPFLAGYTAYKSSRGEKTDFKKYFKSTSRWRNWRSPANPRHVDVSEDHRVTSRPQDDYFDVEEVVDDSDGESRSTPK